MEPPSTHIGDAQDHVVFKKPSTTLTHRKQASWIRLAKQHKRLAKPVPMRSVPRNVKRIRRIPRLLKEIRVQQPAIRTVYVHSEEYLVAADLLPINKGKVRWPDYVSSSHSSHSCLNPQARLVHSLIEAYGLLKGMRLVSPLPATVEQLQEFHDPQYIQMLQRASETLSDEEEDFYEAPSKVSHNGTTHIVCYFLLFTLGNNG